MCIWIDMNVGWLRQLEIRFQLLHIHSGQTSCVMPRPHVLFLWSVASTNSFEKRLSTTGTSFASRIPCRLHPGLQTIRMIAVNALWIGGPYNSVTDSIRMHANDTFSFHQSVGRRGNFPQGSGFVLLENLILFFENLKAGNCNVTNHQIEMALTQLNHI